MELYKSEDDTFFIKLEKENKQYVYMSVNEKIDVSLQDHRCVYSQLTLEKIEEYKIVFNKDIQKQLIENEKYVPYDINENCWNCTVSCFYYTKELNNQILKEYHNFVKNLKDGYYD